MPAFIPGLELNRAFFFETIQPLMREHFPGLAFSAGLVGEGSDVLGFDNEISMDHNWGPRGVLFLPERNFTAMQKRVSRMLSRNLPYTFKGFSTNFTPERKTYLVQPMEPKNKGAINHMVKLFTIRSFFKYYIGFDPYRQVRISDWLTFPQQALIEVTAGEVYQDGLGELERMRKKFFYYPKDVWLYMLRMQWSVIADELSYPARSGQVGDELGSMVIAARMVEKMLKLAFLMERVYIPYNKWLGTAFGHLKCSKELSPIFIKILNAERWKTRQNHIAKAYQVLGRLHNALGITQKLSNRLTDFHGRGFLVLDVGNHIRALDAKISDPKLKGLTYKLGSVDQFISHARINHMHYVYRKLKFLIQ